MKKRAILGVSALLAAAVMPVANVFAADSSLDYANSIGSLEGSDTINYVVEATSDGGYIVGGQAAKCIRFDWSKVPKVTDYDKMTDGSNVPIWEEYPEAAEIVGMSECQDSVEKGSGSKSLDAEALIGRRSCDNYYGGQREGTSSGAKLEDEETETEEPDYEYYVSCIDYAAKFKKDGEKEWQTTIKDTTRPVAVGETTRDYRMITEAGYLYTFDKDGEEGLSTNFDPWNESYSAEFLDDGSFVTRSYYYNGIALFNKNAQYVRTAEVDGDEDVNLYEIEAISSDALYVVGEYRDEQNIYHTATFRLSSDLTESERITDYTNSDNEMTPWVIAANDDGNYILEEHCVWNSESHMMTGCEISIRDKNDEVVKEISSEELAEKYDGAQFIDFNLMFNRGTNTVYLLDDNYDVIAEHKLSEGEEPHDFATLNDGSIVLVGASDTSNDNYEVEGSQNGIQLRIVKAKTEGDSTDQPSNPGTLDNVHIFAIGGVVVLAGSALLTKKMLGRR